MITVMATFVMADGHEIAWEELWPRACALCRQQDGFRAARLLRDVNQPRRFVLHSEWDDCEHVNTFVRTSGLSWLMRGLELFAEHPTIVYLDGVGDAIELS